MLFVIVEQFRLPSRYIYFAIEIYQLTANDVASFKDKLLSFTKQGRSIVFLMGKTIGPCQMGYQKCRGLFPISPAIFAIFDIC